MKEYQNLLRLVIGLGKRKSNRTGVDTVGVVGATFRHDLSNGFPLLTTKKMFVKGIVAELLWFLSGDTNVRRLQAQGVKIWDQWADENGNLGPVYGKQWTRWESSGGFPINQIQNLLKSLRLDPNSRRHIVTAWNPADVPACALPPCHCFFQCFVDDGKLSLLLYMRSADLFLGVPFNIASYALLLVLLCQQTGLMPGELIVSFGDLHIYTNHLDAVMTQIDREPLDLPKVFIVRDFDSQRAADDILRKSRGSSVDPVLIVRPTTDIFLFTPEHIELVGYKSHPAIKAPVAV